MRRSVRLTAWRGVLYLAATDYLPTVRTVGFASTLGWLLLEPGATQASTFTQTAPYLDGQMPS
jgi:hypothetical protein